MSPQGAHAKNQTAFRFDPELLARLKAAAEGHGQTMTDIVARGTEAELDRLDGIDRTSATPAESVSPPPVAVAESGNHAPRAHALTCKCGICKTRTKAGRQ